MKLSITLINRIIIFALASIFFIAVLPYAGFYYPQKHVVDEAIITFNHYDDIADSIFVGEFEGEPKTIEGFNFEQLEYLGNQLNIDFDETIKHIRKPFGSYWIS